ncbi:MAG: O-methyltransferase [Acidobacteriota bacterium]
MKVRDDAILRPAQADYLGRLLPDRDPILAEMEHLAAPGGIPISDPEVGLLLEILVRSVRPGLVVEVGTAIGYGTLCLARGAADARVLSIDPDAEGLDIARGFLTRAGVQDRVELVEEPALDVLARLEGPVDFVYLDAVKTEYRQYLDLLVPKMSIGGMVVADNLLWQGWVADPPPEAARDPNTEALRAFNRYLVGHPQLRATVLPVGDGLGVATRVS